MYKADPISENKEIVKRYHQLLKAWHTRKNPEDKRIVRKAFNLAVDAHKDMRRKTGEPYIFHPLEVARISAAEIGLGTTIWSPLASGLLTGKYNYGIPQDSRANLEGFEWLKKRFTSEEAQGQIAKIQELTRVTDALGTTLPKLALAWCLKNPNVSSVIIGASRLEQVLENLQALELMAKLDPDVMEQIEKILDNKPLLPQF